MLINEYFTRCFYLDQETQELGLDLSRLDFAKVQYDEIFMGLPVNVPLPPEVENPDFIDPRAIAVPEKPAQRYNRQLFEKYITNERYLTRFDDSTYDKLIFPFFDESPVAF